MSNKEAKKYRNYIIFSTVALIISIVLIIYYHENGSSKMYAFILFAVLDLVELIKDIGKFEMRSKLWVNSIGLFSSAMFDGKK